MYTFKMDLYANNLSTVRLAEIWFDKKKELEKLEKLGRLQELKKLRK